ncbi:MAG: hypothetical protein HZA02_06005 [Nitrospinae bacterium]|nr:hypothetical protein [Nitrospinota bacterium]
MDYQKSIVEILDTAKKLTPQKTEVENIFQSAGIKVTGDLAFVSFNGNPESCVKTLMEKLSAMPVVKISAKRIFRDGGITV